jgi:thiol-disulfide isomerase/thioredoxin
MVRITNLQPRYDRNKYTKQVHHFQGATDMTLLSIIIASAGMSLGLVSPDHGHDSMKNMDKQAKSHAHADGESCAKCDAMGAKDKLPTVAAALYTKANWPAENKGEALYAKDLQGQKLPVALGTETWISEKTNLEGKVVILDFWATWCPPCRAAMPILDKMQKENKENLAVVAIGGQSEGEDTVRKYLAEHKESISNVFDANQSVFKPFESEGIPLVVVLSTDGVIRWIGNPHDENFQKAVNQVIENDPMIKAKG